jgi:hypothetical protein
MTMKCNNIVYNEDGTLEKFAVPNHLYTLITSLDKHYDWIKKQTLTEELTLHINFPEENVTISITW